MSITESVRDFLAGCPHLKDGCLRVDYLGDRPTEYTVEVMPGSELVRQYVDGSSVRQYVFLFGSREAFGPDVMLCLENSGFYEDFAEWIRQQNERENYPDIGGGRKVLDIDTLTPGYMFSGNEKTARYQIQCRMTYYQP